MGSPPESLGDWVKKRDNQLFRDLLERLEAFNRVLKDMMFYGGSPRVYGESVADSILGEHRAYQKPITPLPEIKYRPVLEWMPEGSATGLGDACADDINAWIDEQD